MLFWLLGTIAPEIKKEQKEPENKIKVSLKEMPKISKDAGDKKEVIKKPTPEAPPMPKGSQLKEMVTPINEKPPIKYEPKKIQEQKEFKPQERREEKPVQKPKIEPVPPSKPYIELSKPQEEKKEQKTKEAYSWLYEDKSKEEKDEKKAKQSSGSSIGSSTLKELYGDMFGKLTPGQQKYLIDNQEIMRRITQEVLNRVAQVNLTRDINVNRTNVVEFYLHPNGDISDFKFLKKSGYYVLDDTTKETIEYAYSRYPRPDEKILVRYNVYYNLARY
ncbi:energy transducer TonB [Sulfurimonas crateris]|uniref:Energy transducer TonB n=1 Tax=Sulfurimonas crateris TaxID=2574727 RepID=A0A4U2Z8Z8_9BACT|nr:energy transducer TonB [Sulfurimonas crateris]